MTAGRPQGSGSAMGLAGFLGHSNRAGGTASFLGNWKEDKKVKVVFHTKASFLWVYRFPWPKIVTRTRDGKDTREVWSGNFNSWETEDVLKRQYKRDRDTGERLSPPVICPLAILLEEIERLMRDGKCDWDQELFRFEGDDPDGIKVLHAATMTNRIKKLWEDELTDDQKRAARKKGIPGPKEAWKVNMMPKCTYIFTVVDVSKPSDGIQVAEEGSLLGDTVRKAIKDRQVSEGDDAGSPLLNPYVIQWKYDPKSESFDKRYDAIILAREVITDEVMELITKKDPPDLDRFIAPGDIKALRGSMEDAYTGPEGLIDFDMVFAAAEALVGLDGEDQDDVDDGAVQDALDSAPVDDEPADEDDEEESDGEAEAEEEEKVDPKRYLIDKREGKGEDQRVFAADGVELWSCESCSAIVRDDEEACSKCGVVLEDEEDESEPEPAPPPRRRKNTTASAKDGKTKPSKAKGTASARAKASGADGVGF